MDPAEIRQRVGEIRWYHTIDLGHGVVTPGVDPSASRLSKLRFPADMTGKTALDIGAWDGFFSFEFERRGATRVLAVDSFSWSGPGWGTKAGFDLARQVLGSSVEDRELEVLDLSPETVGVFDVVLFAGVLYHLPHPLLALERVASVTGDLLILETQVDLVRERRPAMAFYPGSDLNRDASNWWAPNPPALLAMLRTVGFTRVEVVRAPYRLPLRAARAAKWALRHQNPFRRGLDQGRIAVHATR
jgi:tRNA (mo5U34)-methyltransferase